MKEKLIVAGLNPYCWDSEAVCSKIGLFVFFEELKTVFDGQTIFRRVAVQGLNPLY